MTIDRNDALAALGIVLLAVAGYLLGWGAFFLVAGTALIVRSVVRGID